MLLLKFLEDNPVTFTNDTICQEYNDKCVLKQSQLKLKVCLCHEYNYVLLTYYLNNLDGGNNTYVG